MSSIDEGSAIETVIRETAEHTDNSRITPSDNLMLTFDVDRDKMNDSSISTCVKSDNIRDVNGRRNDLEDVETVSDNFAGPIIVNNDVTVGNTSTANGEKSDGRNDANNEPVEGCKTQDKAPNIRRLDPISMAVTQACSESAVCASSNPDNPSEETVIPNSNEETTLSNFNNPKTGVFSIENKKYSTPTPKTEEHSKCMICSKPLLSKNYCAKMTNIICSQQCLAKFYEKHSQNIVLGRPKENYLAANEESQHNVVPCNVVGENTRVVEIINCKNCITPIQNLNNYFSWQTFDFCNEKCLREYQKSFNPLCAKCGTLIQDENLLWRYRVRFGCNIRQFCSGTCLENYKNNLKICAFCQDDISKHRNVFLTSIGDRGNRKDFCSIRCIENHNRTNQPLKDLNLAEECCVCHERTFIEMEFKFRNEIHQICGRSCLLAFKIVNHITGEKCDFCYKYFATSPPTGSGRTIRYDGILKRFCQDTCRNNYITSNRKVYTCHWCKVKRYNFDMIQKYNADKTVLITCSLPCLRSSISSIASATAKSTACKVCHRVGKEKFCIVPTDGPASHFCSSQCVRKYLHVTGMQLVQANRHVVPDAPGPLPVITSVRSLASRSSRTGTGRFLPNASQAELSTPSPTNVIVLKSPNLPSVRNVATSARPTTADAGVHFKPIMNDKETLTEKLNSFNLLTVPVPIYVPSPMPLFNLVHLKPMLFPLPIPIPILIPLTIQTTNILLNNRNQDPQFKITKPGEVISNFSAEPLDENRGQAKDANKNETNVTPTEPKLVGDDYSLMKDASIQCDFEDAPIDFEEQISASTITSTSITVVQFGESAIEKIVYPRQKCETSIAFNSKEKSEPKMRLKHIYGVNAWKRWVDAKNDKLRQTKAGLLKSDLIELSAKELGTSLALFIKEARNPNGAEYTPDTIYYFCLSIQLYLQDHERVDNIFGDEEYKKFNESLDVVCEKFPICNDSKNIVTRIEEEHLWESKQLGAHSPHALLNAIMFLTTKYFDLMTVEDHMQLSFSKIARCTESIVNEQGKSINREILRYQSTCNDADGKTKIYKVNLHDKNPLRCFVKLYDFYLSKCPKSPRTRGEVFYLLPKKCCPSSSMYWYTTTPLGDDMIRQLFRRLKMVKEINVAMLAL